MIWPQHNNVTNVMWHRFIPALIVLFLFALLFSPVAMMTDQQGAMVNCPFERGMSSMCPMTLADHFSAWRELWLAVNPGLIVALALAVVAGIAGSLVGVVSSPLVRTHHFWRYRWRLSYQPVTYLSELYSDGIVQPRLYA